MTDIAIVATLNDAPVNALVDDPEITIVRLDTDAVVVNADTMVDTGAGGIYDYAFTPVAGVPYAISIEADPSATGQTDQNVYTGAIDNEQNDIWRDRGLDPANSKAITEVTVGEDYDEAVGGAGEVAIAKDVTKVGAVTTIDRA